MSNSSSKNGLTDCPEYAVRAEAIGRFLTPPLASSTFHDLVKKGKINPMKDIRGFYLLNASLRRLGLREAGLPENVEVDLRLHNPMHGSLNAAYEAIAASHGWRRGRGTDTHRRGRP